MDFLFFFLDFREVWRSGAMLGEMAGFFDGFLMVDFLWISGFR